MFNNRSTRGFIETIGPAAGSVAKCFPRSSRSKHKMKGSKGADQSISKKRSFCFTTLKYGGGTGISDVCAIPRKPASIESKTRNP